MRITKREGQLCAGLAATSLAGFFILARLLPDERVLRMLLSRPLWSTVITLLAAQAALAVIVALALWAHQAGPTDHRAYAGAILGVIALSLGAQGLLPALGAPSSGTGFHTNFQAPLPLLALLSAMSAVACRALLLLGYRWLRARRGQLALVLYLGLILVTIYLALFGDQSPLRAGHALAVRGSWALTYDLALLLLPLLLYELLRRHWYRARAALPRPVGAVTAPQPR